MTSKRTFVNFAPFAVIGAAFIAIFAISNRSSPYAAPQPFVGCYESPAGDKLQFSTDGQIIMNSSAAGSYRILAPVGGKHGYLVEAQGLDLSQSGNSVVARAGHGGFYWPIDGQTLHIIFAPSSQVQFQKAAKEC